MTAGVAVGALVAGSAVGDRRSARDLKIDRTVPPWRAWRTRSRAARCIRWIETYCRIPSGDGAGSPMRLAPFQKRSIDALLAVGVRSGGLQIPRGNAKSTLWAAVGLWALCDHDDSPQIPLVASTAGHAMRTLFRPARRMVELDDELRRRLVVYSSTSDRRIWSAWNDGELLPLPANVDRLQGLNPTVALVDEAQTVPVDVLTSIAQGAGKRAASLVLAIGTPAPHADASALFDLRARAADGARVAWIEYAAEPGCAVGDRRQWRKANPGLAAGFLFADVLEAELTTVPEAAFRMYRLGQWTDYTETGWLPPGSWDELPHADPPPDGTEIMLGLAGTWTSSIALVGATLDGAVFLAWAADAATDDELEETISAAWSRWTVRSLVVAPRTRAALVRRLTDAGLPVDVWPSTTALEIGSSTEFRRAIVEGKIAHDHHPLLAEHVAALVGTAGADGALRLTAPADGREVDAARAARIAWWRAVEAGEAPAPAIY